MTRHLKGAPASQGGRFRTDLKAGDVIHLGDARDAKQLAGVLDTLRNGLGEPITDEARERVVALLESPSRETWDEGRSVIIGRSTTVWQALLRHTDFDTMVASTSTVVDDGFPPFRPAVYATEPKGEIPTSTQLRVALTAVAENLREAEHA